MHFDNGAILFALFASVVGLPLLTLVKSLSEPVDTEELVLREPRMVDAAYPSTWLAKGWSRKYVKAPLECDSLMELYTTSVRYLQEKNWNLAKLYTERCKTVMADRDAVFPALLANLENNLGVVDFYIGSAEKSRAQFEKAILLACEAQDDTTLVTANLNLAATLIFLNDLSSAARAVDLAQQAIIRADGENSRHLIDIKCMEAKIRKSAAKK